MLLEHLIQLNEKLGNLKQLDVGPMINMLKQNLYHRSRKHDSLTTPTDSRFYYGQGVWNTIGSESEIIDAGVMKKGIADLRKAYRTHGENDIAAFAIYVDGQAVAFGRFSFFDLGGSSREGILAYDLTPFKDEIEQDSPSRKLTSYRKEEFSGKVREYYGQPYSTGSLKEFLERLVHLAKTKGQTVTMKLVTVDLNANRKRAERAERLTNKEIYTGLNALRQRLLQHKINKKPTANSLEEFVDMVFRNAAKEIRFGDHAFRTTPVDSYDMLKPTEILGGKAFTVEYRSIKDRTDRIELSYAFDKETGTIQPFKARYYSQVVALEPRMFLQREYGITKLEKQDILARVLKFVKEGNHFKAEQLIQQARKLGHDYPEFKTIEKSINLENS